MRILYIYPELTIKGGADKIIIEKANYFATHGYDVIIVTESQMGRQTAFSLHSAVKHIDLGLDFNKQYTQSFLMRGYTYLSLMYQYKKRLWTVLEQEKPDITITTLGRSIDFVTKMKDGSVKVGEAHTVKAHLRSFHLMEQRGFVYRCVARYMKWCTSRRVSKLTALVLLTKEDAAAWTEAQQTFVIPNPISFYPAEGAPLQNKKVIMIGRYNDAKGYDYLIPAWTIVHQKHPDWVLDVYGSGELHDQVVQWIKERNLESCILLHDPVENIMEKYLESSICVLSSRYEGFSLVILEGMACGVPFVSFDSPYGPRNIIRNGEDGLLVEYLNPQALADGICQLIENENLRYQLGKRARDNVKRFSKDNVMGQWDELFKSLL